MSEPDDDGTSGGGTGGGTGGGERQREQRLKLLEDDIGRALAESERSGELRSAPSFGKPLEFADGYDETPAEWRMPMKILRDAGVVPPEVEAMQELGRLRQALAEAGSGDEADALRQRIVDLEQRLALRLEALRIHGSF